MQETKTHAFNVGISEKQNFTDKKNLSNSAFTMGLRDDGAGNRT